MISKKPVTKDSFKGVILIIIITTIIVLIQITIYRELAIVLKVPTQSKPTHTLTVLINPPHLENIENVSENISGKYRKNTDVEYICRIPKICVIYIQRIPRIYSYVKYTWRIQKYISYISGEDRKYSLIF